MSRAARPHELAGDPPARRAAYRLIGPFEAEAWRALLAETRDDATGKRLSSSSGCTTISSTTKYATMFRTESTSCRGSTTRRGARDRQPSSTAPHTSRWVRTAERAATVLRATEFGRRIPRDCAQILIEVLRLDYVHDVRDAEGRPLDLVHREVARNILISFDGDVKPTDSASPSAASIAATTVGIVRGKARYLSPEQILGMPATRRSDIFSAACVAWELLTGEPLFERASVPKTLYAIAHGQRPDLATLLPFRAPLLVSIVHRALATKPEERPSSAAEFAEDLDAARALLGRPRIVVDSARIFATCSRSRTMLRVHQRHSRSRRRPSDGIRGRSPRVAKMPLGLQARRAFPPWPSTRRLAPCRRNDVALSPADTRSRRASPSCSSCNRAREQRRNVGRRGPAWCVRSAARERGSNADEKARSPAGHRARVPGFCPRRRGNRRWLRASFAADRRSDGRVANGTHPREIPCDARGWDDGLGGHRNRSHDDGEHSGSTRRDAQRTHRVARYREATARHERDPRHPRAARRPRADRRRMARATDSHSRIVDRAWTPSRARGRGEHPQELRHRRGGR